MTTEFVRNLDADPPFSLIEQESLASRLIREFQAAVGELTRDPRGFIRELFSADTKDAKRRQRIYVGLTCALVVHVALVVLIAVLGWRTMFVKHVDEASEGTRVYFPIVSPKAERQATSRGMKDPGGGGDHNPLPPTRGPLPATSLSPAIIKPNTASVKLPSLPATPTIVGPDGSKPPPGVALGVPTGVIAAAPSPGPGEGGGLGGNRGPGAGPGNGSGSGKGNPGGTGDRNRIGSPNGADDPKGPIPYPQFERIPERSPIVWLHRPTPVITPEAQTNKVKGEVWLRATFGEDGKISDIEVIRDVPFMTESAVEALQRSRFRPATIKGRPVTLINVPVRINVDVIQR